MKIKRPLVILAILVGIISVTATFLDIVCAMVLTVTAAFVTGLYAALKKREYFVFTAVCVLVLLSIVRNYAIINGYESTQEICGEVVETQQANSGVNYVIRVNNGKLYGSKVSLWTNNAYFGVGDTVNVTAALYSSDYSGDRAEMIFSKGKIISVNSIGVSKLGKFLENMRNGICNKLFSYMSQDSAEILSALLVGNRDYLKDDFVNQVRNAGLSHVLVVSGMHMAVLVGGVLKLLEKSRMSKILSSFTAMAFTVFFMAICGFTPSVMRAGITYFIMIFAGLIIRKNDAVSSLCTAVVIITVFNPFIFGSVSFLLSVSATAGVLVLYPFILSKYDFKNKYLSAIWQAVLLSVSAVVCTMPVTIIFFNTVNVMAILTSVLVSVPVQFALVVGAIAVVIPCIPGFDAVVRFPFFITDIVLRYFSWIVKFFG